MIFDSIFELMLSVTYCCLDAAYLWKLVHYMNLWSNGCFYLDNVFVLQLMILSKLLHNRTSSLVEVRGINVCTTILVVQGIQCLLWNFWIHIYSILGSCTTKDLDGCLEFLSVPLVVMMKLQSCVLFRQEWDL